MNANETTIKNGLQWVVEPVRVLDLAHTACAHCSHYLAAPLHRLEDDGTMYRYSVSWWHVAGPADVEAIGERPCGDPTPQMCQACGEKEVLPIGTFCQLCDEAQAGEHR